MASTRMMARCPREGQGQRQAVHRATGPRRPKTPGAALAFVVFFCRSQLRRHGCAATAARAAGSPRIGGVGGSLAALGAGGATAVGEGLPPRRAPVSGVARVVALLALPEEA